MKTNQRILGVAVLLASVLAGCGGGGDSAPAANYDVAKAWQNYLTGTHSWAASGTGSEGKSYALTYEVAPGPVSVFPRTGANGARADVTSTIRVNGVLQPFFPFLGYVFYNAASYGVFGWQAVTVPSCSTDVAGPALPTAAAVGTGGAFYVETEYADCVPGSAATGTTVATWSLELDSGYPLFCMNSTERDLAGIVAGTGALCFEVAADGTLGRRFRSTSAGGGTTLTVRNF